jgi:hypothetical protein
MIHEANIDAATFERIGREELRAIVRSSDVDYQSGDNLRLFRADRWGGRDTYYVDRDEKGRFASEYRPYDPIFTVITHVQRTPELVDGKVLLSLHVQSA